MNNLRIGLMMEIFGGLGLIFSIIEWLMAGLAIRYIILGFFCFCLFGLGFLLTQL